jgi:hypothetical protein
MKTKLFSTALIVLVCTSAFAQTGQTQRLAIIKHHEPGVFKVIYEGDALGKVRMEILDKDNETVYEDVNTVDAFIRKLNFTGMQPGEYTIRIADKDGKQSQTIVYGMKKSSIKDMNVVKVSGENKYLLAVTNESPEQIHLNIFDGSKNLVHSSDMLITGQLRLIYNLKDVEGIPTFEITDATGFTRTLAKR